MNIKKYKIFIKFGLILYYLYIYTLFYGYVFHYNLITKKQAKH